MSKPEDTILTIFRRVSEALDSLSYDEIRRLSDPQYTVEVRAVRRRSKEESIDPPADIDVDSIIEKISAMATRPEAQEFLDAKFPSRKLLEPIARKLDIPIVKQDRLEALRDKIIEATVGARIRSQTIQGTGAPAS